MDIQNKTAYSLKDPTIEEFRLSNAIKNRKIYFRGTVNSDEVFKALYVLDKIQETDEKLNLPKKPIEIMISSYGGEVYSGFSLMARIESLQDAGYEVNTTVTDVAMSMGSFMLITGTKRRAYRNSRIMIHQVSSGSWGTLKEMEMDVAEVTALWERGCEYLLKKTLITRERLDEIKEKKIDWYMWADEALELGVIDEII